MEAFELTDLLQLQQSQGKRYHEFIHVQSLSAGIYTLPAGGIDPQQPHTEDEIYYIIRGRASICVGVEDRLVQPGSIIFVPAGIEHRFHTIQEDLTIFVLFTPAEYSGNPQAGT